MSVAIRVELDARQLEAWAGQTVRAITSQLRSAVDKSARYARNKTIPVMQADSGVPKARFRAAVPTVRSSPLSGPISATWTVGKSANSIRDSGGGVSFVRGTPMRGSTFRVTGGGSAGLVLPRGFVINGRNGGRVVVTRQGPGKYNFKEVYAESPNTGMAQADGAPRKAWEAAAADSVGLLIAAGVSAAMAGQATPSGVSGLNGPTG